MRAVNQISLTVFSTLLIFSVTGCDLIQSAKDLLKKEEPKKTVVSKAASKNSGPLAANELVKIGSWRMTLDEFNERLTALKGVLPDFDENDLESKKLVLDELIRQQLVVADAEQSGLAESKEIADAVEEFRRTLIVRQAAAEMTENIDVTEEEIQAFYDENKEILIEPIEMKVRSIVLTEQPAANDLLIQILQGADFAEMAKQNSIADNAAEGGDMGWITDVPFPEMANALIPLEKGDVSSVFRGPDGFYIVKVDDKKGGEQIPLQEVKEDIRQNRIIFKQQEVIVDYIEELRSKFDIETNEALLSQ